MNAQCKILSSVPVAMIVANGYDYFDYEEAWRVALDVAGKASALLEVTDMDLPEWKDLADVLISMGVVS